MKVSIRVPNYTVCRLMDDYGKEFTSFKQDKRLKFLPQLGTVDLSIELKDRTVDVTVPPLEAAIIELFSGKGMVISTVSKEVPHGVQYSTDTWNVEEICKELDVDSSSVRKGLETWIDHGVMCETQNNAFFLLEEAGDAQTASNRPTTSRHGIVFLLSVPICYKSPPF